jgi:hypothetical protein
MVKVIVNSMLIMHTFRLSANLNLGDIEDKSGPDRNKYVPLFSVTEEPMRLWISRLIHTNVIVL